MADWPAGVKYFICLWTSLIFLFLIFRETVQKSLKDLTETGAIRLSTNKIEIFMRDIGNLIGHKKGMF
jgi:hypothetical protein